jgi:hypothetical protein
VLQNISKYKLRADPRKKNAKALDWRPTNKNLSPVQTRDLLKQNTTSSPSSVGNSSPCQENSIDTLGIERAFTFAVEEGAMGWNLPENNARNDPIPPEPVALNEAKLLCREAMTLITEEVSSFFQSSPIHMLTFVRPLVSSTTHI